MAHLKGYVILHNRSGMLGGIGWCGYWW